MPMFFTPKPRQFRYQPRLFDPEKEELEKLKTKYAILKEADDHRNGVSVADPDSELAYFERKIQEMDRSEKKRQSRFSVSDLVKKREMPRFNYTPRFSPDASGTSPEAAAATGNATKENLMQRTLKRKMSRRFDMEDTDYFKPISAGKIMMSVIIVFLLLLWILL